MLSFYYFEVAFLKTKNKIKKTADVVLSSIRNYLTKYKKLKTILELTHKKNDAP